MKLFGKAHNPAPQLRSSTHGKESPFSDRLLRKARASRPLIITSLIIVAVGAWLTVSPLAETLGLVALPPLYRLLLAVMLLGYVMLTQVLKTWFFRRFGE